MNTNTILLSVVLFAQSAVAEDLLKARDWTSSDGKKLNATLIETDGKTVKLKRSNDGRVFDLETTKLSENDNSLIAKSINQMDEKIKNQSFGVPKQITEQELDLALRLNKHEKLWEAVEHMHKRWIEVNMIMTPKKIKRINDKEAIIIGNHSAIRFVNKSRSYKLHVVGDKLLFKHINNSYELKKYRAERGKLYSILAFSSDKKLTSFSRENIDLDSIITITYDFNG